MNFSFEKKFFMNFHEVYEYFWKIFLFFVILIFYFKIFFYECSWSLWVFSKDFSFFFSHILIFHLLYHGAAYIHWSLENSSYTYGTSQLFGLFRLFKSYEFFSKRLHFSSFKKALIDTSNLSISFVLIKFVIFFVKIRFLNFTMLFEKFKYFI